MSPTLRLGLYLMFPAMFGFGLNVFVEMIVATAMGPHGVPSPLRELVDLAYWPTALCGVPHEHYFYPEGWKCFVTNILGWTLLGGLLGLVHAAIALLASRKQRPQRDEP
jgi:hypothetical protein